MEVQLPEAVANNGFFVFRQCFQIFFLQIVKPFTKQSQILTTLRKKPSESIVGKVEIAGKQHFLLFLQCFLLCKK